MRLPFRRPRTAPAAPRSTPPILSTALASAVGLLVLLDLIVAAPLLDAVGAALVEYGLIVAAFALLLGVLNLLTVHNRKVQERTVGWPYSLFLILVATSLFVFAIFWGPEMPLFEWLLRYVLVPLQSSFFALLPFFLVGVAFRALRVNSVERLLFVLSAALVIVGATPLGVLFGSALSEARTALLVVPATAGGRGLLLGIALGTIATGLRLLVDGRRYFR